MGHEHDFSKDANLISTHYAEEYERYYNSIIPPVFLNSLNVFASIDEYYDADKFDDHTYIYGRVSNPTVRILEKKLAALEHGNDCAVFASGMAAATTAVMGTCKAGSHIVCVKNCYGPLRVFLTDFCAGRMGMTIHFVKGNDIAEFEDAVSEQTDLIVLESPSSIVMSLQDLRKVAQLAKKHNAKTYIDNTYCTPLLQNPLDLGIDIVMHTLSKYLGGHSDVIAGALITKDEQLHRELLGVHRELFGGIIGPMEAWLVIRGQRTLDVRLERHQKTAMAVAHYLETHPKVKRVLYPSLPEFDQYTLGQTQQRGACGLMSFELDADHTKAKQVVNALEVFKIGVSWGGFESLACMPFLRQTDEQNEWFGGDRGLIRIHCGLEGAQNLLSDLDQALNGI